MVDEGRVLCGVFIKIVMLLLTFFDLCLYRSECCRERSLHPMR